MKFIFEKFSIEILKQNLECDRKMGTVKDTTHEIIFDDSYPHNVPVCRHGPALRLKSMKRTNLGGVKTSEKWVCRLVLKFCFILLFDLKL